MIKYPASFYQTRFQNSLNIPKIRVGTQKLLSVAPLPLHPLNSTPAIAYEFLVSTTILLPGDSAA
jgi:hypothetical protein